MRFLGIRQTACSSAFLSAVVMVSLGCEKVPTFQELTGQQQNQTANSTPSSVPAVEGKITQPSPVAEVPKPTPIDPTKFLLDFTSKPPETITDADLNTLANLESGRDQIQSLNLTRASVSDEGLQNLTKLPELNQLDLTFTGIEGRGIAALQNCVKLKKLSLSNALRMTSEGWDAVSKLPQLEVLDVSSTNAISDAEVAKFIALPNLRELNLSRSQVTDAVFQSLAEMENLEVLKIERNGLLKGHGLQAYTRTKPILREIHASGTVLEAGGLRHIKSIPSLDFLDISNSSLDDRKFAELKGANKLVHLKIGQNFLTNAGMQTVLTMSKLKILDLEGMNTINDPGLGILAKKAGLQTLNAKAVPFSPQAIQAFQKIHKNCEVLTSQ